MNDQDIALDPAISSLEEASVSQDTHTADTLPPPPPPIVEDHPVERAEKHLAQVRENAEGVEAVLANKKEITQLLLLARETHLISVRKIEKDLRIPETHGAKVDFERFQLSGLVALVDLGDRPEDGGALFDDDEPQVTPARPTTRKPTRARKPGRLKRRSLEEIHAVVDRMVSLLRSEPAGLRAEHIKERLGLDVREMPRALAEGLKTKALRCKGRKRATTYFVGAARKGKR